MKVGFRKPSLKKSLKARTTAKWKRQAKKMLLFQDMGRKAQVGLKILKKLLTIKSITKQLLACQTF